VNITVALAFVVSVPAPLFSTIASMLSPYAVDTDQVEVHAGEFLAGRTFDKKVPGVACDHCGTVQEVTIPISISRIEGDRDYGPGGSATVLCSNPGCNKTFPVNWDNVIVEIDMK
jgi:hypothetical protein